jgi:hypothetical protein
MSEEPTAGMQIPPLARAIGNTLLRFAVEMLGVGLCQATNVILLWYKARPEGFILCSFTGLWRSTGLAPGTSGNDLDDTCVAGRKLI